MTHDQQQRAELARHRETVAASAMALEQAKRDVIARRNAEDEEGDRWNPNDRWDGDA